MTPEQISALAEPIACVIVFLAVLLYIYKINQ